ncbi:hypothetical protein M413DRAFT_26137 [Hebeloma cylindrosporum]|uniref:Fe2OG dioxygenase domain-containing protein n=1 Tax=Hebeloma cylindrosporum TaxID=76867 RepID=A0A0C3CJC8_HEBCY|nr:hypothetical protein M413DRAFT_26137 [Hebeloma cylindrosporum h7]
MPVKLRTPLGNTLTQLSNTPAISFTATHYQTNHWSRTPCAIADISLKISGKDAGTFGNPDIAKITEKSKPSPFGKGDKTVMDLEYRDGRKVVGADIVLGGAPKSEAQKGLYELIENHISGSLFVDKCVKIKLHKLAVYGKEGHFDWHRDTTHGDNHHATVLVALNTEWKGRSLGLRYGEEEVDVDMHVQSVLAASGKKDDEDEDKDLCFQIIAFYTDIEHKVDNITDGTRIVFQFDVKVESNEEDDWEGEDEEHDESCVGRCFGNVVSDTMKPLFPLSRGDTSRHVILEKLVEMIKDLHTSRSIDEVVFPLRHLYRLASIKPEYLKGVDAYVYEALKKTFDVDLKSIMLFHETNYKGRWESDNVVGFPFVSEHDKERKRPAKKRKLVKKIGDSHSCAIPPDVDEQHGLHRVYWQ